jgi:hypothetical protein
MSIVSGGFGPLYNPAKPLKQAKDVPQRRASGDLPDTAAGLIWG